ncbi:MAG: hypothetical protein RDV48_26780 [Candidatus Eremiobacteraeota bacterium]|nr:hypothetical protein [Candidatus Eremiobacteraeota bacterium]
MRKDFYLYNEAGGFCLHSRGMGGLSRRGLLEDLPGKVKEGLVIPVELVQDDSFRVRVVLGDLEKEEEEQWIGKLVWKLQVPDGCLAVEGGLDPETRDGGDHVRYLDIPPGEYLVEIHTLLTGVNGRACLESAEGSEALGAWFRRTRGDEPMPAWLKYRLLCYPQQDPGHEHDWEALQNTAEEMSLEREAEKSPTIDFLVRLSPLERDPPALPGDFNGWFSAAANARIPERFPTGLPVAGIEPGRESRPPWRPQSPEASHLLESVAEAVSPLEGGPVGLPLSSLHHLARIASWLNETVWAVMLLEPPEGEILENPGLAPTFSLGIEAQGGRMLLSLRPRDKLSLAADLQKISSSLAGMPQGTLLELVFGNYGGTESEGSLRFRGILKRGIVTVTHAFPPVQCASLAGAVDFSAYFEEGKVKARDTGEAERVMKCCRSFGSRWVEVIGLSVKDDTLELAREDPGELWNVARFAFAMQCSGIWPAWTWWDRFHPEGRPDGA